MTQQATRNKKNTKSNNFLVNYEFNNLNPLLPFGIMYNDSFIEIRNMSIDDGKLFYKNNYGEKKSVSSFIKDIKGLQTARWINHLYFKDGYGKKRSFKKFVSQKYNLKFT
tara:strand:+ start:452 stop:781 length:330 start_codon:yes stop_codon:yes gene_type:complete